MKKANPAEVSALESHLGFWLRFVSNQVSGRFENLLASHDISVGEWVAMRALYRNTGTTHAGLVGALGMTKGATSKIISKLERKGLVERLLVKDSMRDQTLRLTKAGNELLPRLAALADENDTHFFGYLTDSQRKSLMSLMKGLVIHHQLKQVPIE